MTDIPEVNKRTKSMDRFSAKCEDVGDHAIWKGTKDSRKRYGLFRYDGKLIRAHRASWLLFEGPLPGGAAVRSTCKVKFCVAPAHLKVDVKPIEAA